MRSISAVPQMVRNAGRLQQVVAVLAKYGLAPWLSRVPLNWVQKQLETVSGRAISKLSGPERVREAVTEIGTTFIKLAQILSTRPDVVGLELAEELSHLQSQTPPDDFAAVRELVVAELGRPLEEVYTRFDEKPLASASIGQVHRAMLRDGSDVVVKVQHSGIEQKIRNDLEIAQELARLAETYSTELALYQPIATVRELQKTLLAELDFCQELRNLQAFADHFKSDAMVRFPRPYPEFSTSRILTMEYLQGVHVSRQSDISAAGHDPQKIACKGAQVFLDMVFRDGFFHADPHPGNLLLLNDGAIGVIDCGMVGRIDDQLREQIEDMMVAGADSDVEGFVDTLVSLADLPNGFDRPALNRDAAEFFDQYAMLSLADVDVSEVLAEAVSAIREHQIRLPARVSMLIKMIAVLEGTAEQISPEFRLIEVLRPYRKKVLARRMSVSRLRRKITTAMRRWQHLMDIVPGDVADILERVKQGSFDVHLEHRRLDVIVNRLVLGILCAALFIGASVLWSSNVPPRIGEYSIPGSLGCAVAVYYSIRLLRAIKASGDL